jgi:hypothetical protein
MRRGLFNVSIVTVVLILQLIPLVLFPAQSWVPQSLEWLLPALLVLMVIIADFQIIVRHTASLGMWYLLAFAQGFNIISRIMMVWSHATTGPGPTGAINWPYIVLTIIAMLMSTFMLWYTEQPDVRMAYLAK